MHQASGHEMISFSFIALKFVRKMQQIIVNCPIFRLFSLSLEPDSKLVAFTDKTHADWPIVADAFLIWQRK